MALADLGACAGLAIIAAGIWAAYRPATRIEHAVAALVPPAIALGRGEAVDVPESRYSETAMLGRSLLHASACCPRPAGRRTTIP